MYYVRKEDIRKIMKPEYVITDGVRFIRQNIHGKYESTTNPSLADTWESVPLASSILKNALPKVTRWKFYVAQNQCGKFIKCTASEAEKNGRRKKLCSTDDAEEKRFPLTKYSFEKDTDVQYWIQGFELLRNIFEEAYEAHENLVKRESNIDLVRNDLSHILGAKKFNASDGYKNNDLNQKVFLKRMSVKNQIRILEVINKNAFIASAIKEICEVIDEIKNQTYQPRILIDMFEKGEITSETEKIIENL